MASSRKAFRAELGKLVLVKQFYTLTFFGLFVFKCLHNISYFNYNLARISCIQNCNACSSSECVTPKYIYMYITNWGQSKSDYLEICKGIQLIFQYPQYYKSVSGFIRNYFSQSVLNLQHLFLQMHCTPYNITCNNCIVDFPKKCN